LRQAIGEVDFSVSIDKLQQSYGAENIIVCDSVEAVRVQIDNVWSG